LLTSGLLYSDRIDFQAFGYKNCYFMSTLRQHNRSTAALKVRDIRLLIGAVGLFSFGSRALAVIIGFQIWKITHSKAALGWLGLIEAIPAITIAPFGGYIADHFNRRWILIITRSVSCLCAFAMAWLSFGATSSAVTLGGLYSMIFLAGVARGFADPAGTAFEAQVVPKHLTVNAASWISSTWILSSVAGPALSGFIFAAIGASKTYAIIGVLFFLALICMYRIAPKMQARPEKEEKVIQSIVTGWRFVRHNGILLPSMALDLFAVFFGGAMALLPVYADDILKVGAQGLGLLNAAPSLGALLITLAATRKPPIAQAGKNLLWTIAGFGLTILVFA